jgi:hypothetical protein
MARTQQTSLCSEPALLHETRCTLLEAAARRNHPRGDPACTRRAPLSPQRSSSPLQVSFQKWRADRYCNRSAIFLECASAPLYANVVRSTHRSRGREAAANHRARGLKSASAGPTRGSRPRSGGPPELGRRRAEAATLQRRRRGRGDEDEDEEGGEEGKEEGKEEDSESDSSCIHVQQSCTSFGLRRSRRPRSRTANLLRGSGPGEGGYRPHSTCSKCSCSWCTCRYTQQGVLTNTGIYGGL